MALNNLGLGFDFSEQDRLDLNRRLLGPSLAAALDITDSLNRYAKLVQSPAERITRAFRNPFQEALESLPGYQIQKALESSPRYLLQQALESSPSYQIQRALESGPSFLAQQALSNLSGLDLDRVDWLPSILKLSPLLDRATWSAKSLLRHLLWLPEEDPELQKCYSALAAANANDIRQLETFTAELGINPDQWPLVVEALHFYEEYWSNAIEPLSYLRRVVARLLWKRAREERALIRVPKPDKRRSAPPNFSYVPLDEPLHPAGRALQEELPDSFGAFEALDLERLLGAHDLARFWEKNQAPPEVRRLFMLRHEGYTLPEAQHLLGLSDTEIERVRKALERLRLAYKKYLA